MRLVPSGYAHKVETDDLVREALKPGPESREQLAGKLRESLDERTAGQDEAVWAEEAARRDLEPSSEDRPAEQVFKELRKRLA